MFNLAEWLKASMISGVVKGQVSLAFVAVKSEDYLSRGIFTEADIAKVAERAIEPVTEPPVEEIPEEEPIGEEI